MFGLKALLLNYKVNRISQSPLCLLSVLKNALIAHDNTSFTSTQHEILRVHQWQRQIAVGQS